MARRSLIRPAGVPPLGGRRGRCRWSFSTLDYYYPQWAALGLDLPPPGFRWVRYGPVLLLVDVSTGEVAEVVYGVFDDD